MFHRHPSRVTWHTSVSAFLMWIEPVVRGSRVQLYEYFKPGLTQIVLATGKATCPRLPLTNLASFLSFYLLSSSFALSFIFHVCHATSSPLFLCSSSRLCYPFHRVRITASFMSSSLFTVYQLTLANSVSLSRIVSVSSALRIIAVSFVPPLSYFSIFLVSPFRSPFRTNLHLYVRLLSLPFSSSIYFCRPLFRQRSYR